MGSEIIDAVIVERWQRCKARVWKEAVALDLGDGPGLLPVYVGGGVVRRGWGARGWGRKGSG